MSTYDPFKKAMAVRRNSDPLDGPYYVNGKREARRRARRQLKRELREEMGR